MTMWRRHRRRSAITLTVWSISVAGFAALVCWHFGWLPIAVETPETGTLGQSAVPTGAMPPPAINDNLTQLNPFDNLDDPAHFVKADSVVFELQSEPPVEEGPSDDSLFSKNNPQPETAFNLQDRDLASRPPRRFDRSPGVDSELSATQIPDGSVRNADFHVTAGKSGVPQRGSQTDSLVQVGGIEPQRSALPAEAQDQLQEIDRLLQEDESLVAHRKLSKLYWDKPQWRETIRERIEKTAQAIYFSPQPHYMQPYEIQPDDQLRIVARRYNVPWEYLVRLNRLDPRRIRPGQKIKVIKGPFSARIDVGKFEMTIHAHGYFVRRYSIGVGKDGTTPIGKFEVAKKLVNPTYYGPDGVIDADDPKNPLGERWIDLGDSYGIHGTIDPLSIGQAISRGCIRMHNADVEEVFDLLGTGSEVVIRP